MTTSRIFKLYLFGLKFKISKVSFCAFEKSAKLVDKIRLYYTL